MSDVKPRLDIRTLRDQFNSLVHDVAGFQSMMLDFFRYTRGEDAIISLAGTNIAVAASQTDQNIASWQPPFGEEWDVLSAHVYDTANIDTGDTVKFMLGSTPEVVNNVNGNNAVCLSSVAGGGVVIKSGGITTIQWMWPNGFSNLGVLRPSELLTLRSLKPVNPATIATARIINTSITTTATVGTRSLNGALFVRRRIL